jgi:hypothetical protein
MPLAPFLLAAFFGLLISALLYFVLIWPSREPPNDSDDSDDSDDDGGGDGIDDAPGPPGDRDDLDRPAGKRARGGAAARSRRNAT